MEHIDADQPISEESVGKNMMTSITTNDFNRWRFNRDAVHFNGGKVFFGYGHRCVDQPRLLVIDKYFRADRSTQRSYLIDGRLPCATLDEALAALSQPPVVSPEDMALLQTVPADGWLRPDERAPFLPLGEIGMIEWGRDGQNNIALRITDAGRSARGLTEENCPGHVASATDPKVCGRCGTHIGSLRPDDDAP